MLPLILVYESYRALPTLPDWFKSKPTDLPDCDCIFVAISQQQCMVSTKYLPKIAKNSIIAMRFERFLLGLERNKKAFGEGGGANLYQFFFRAKLSNLKKS